MDYRKDFALFQIKSLAVAVAVVFGNAAAAQDIVGSYVAYIGQDDLYNSSGARLSEPWQVLRQDRANFHRFGIAQPGDEWDSFFGSIENRAIMERMVMNGSIDPQASRDLLRGGATVFVRIYGKGTRADYVRVTVVN